VYAYCGSTYGFSAAADLHGQFLPITVGKRLSLRLVMYISLSRGVI